MADFLRSDEPAVRNAAEGEVDCAGCDYWSRWLDRAGDCLIYALRRRRALLSAHDLGIFAEAWPVKSARITADYETCHGWEARNNARTEGKRANG